MTDHNDGPSRRKVMECMTSAGTGVLWTVRGGVPQSLGLVDRSRDRRRRPARSRFAQVSDTHIGFKNPINADPNGTLTEALARITAAKPAFMLHTGDVTHLAKPEEFDQRRPAAQDGAARRHSTCRASTT